MTEKPPERWPKDFPGPDDCVFAIGVAALNYGILESAFRFLFSTVTGMTEAQVSTIFDRIPNNTRQEIVKAMMTQSNLPEPALDAVRHFLTGFKQCADNRHDLMHSRHGGRFVRGDSRGMVLHKYYKSGEEAECPVTVQDLRNIADEIESYMIFGMMLASGIQNFMIRRTRATGQSFALSPLYGKPPPPSRLNWNSVQRPQAPSAQPESSEG